MLLDWIMELRSMPLLQLFGRRLYLMDEKAFPNTSAVEKIHNFMKNLAEEYNINRSNSLNPITLSPVDSDLENTNHEKEDRDEEIDEKTFFNKFYKKLYKDQLREKHLVPLYYYVLPNDMPIKSWNELFLKIKDKVKDNENKLLFDFFILFKNDRLHPIYTHIIEDYKGDLYNGPYERLVHLRELSQYNLDKSNNLLKGKKRERDHISTDALIKMKKAKPVKEYHSEQAKSKSEYLYRKK